MRSVLSVLFPIVILASTSVTALDEKGPVALKDHPGLKGYTATGVVKRCISNSSVRGTSILDDWTMRFRANHKKYYVNRLPKKCNRLDFYNSYVHKSFGGNMCAREFIHVNEGNDISPVPCSLGEFHEYTKDAKSKD